VKSLGGLLYPERSRQSLHDSPARSSDSGPSLADRSLPSRQESMGRERTDVGGDNGLESSRSFSHRNAQEYEVA
jgi:hypothetical protein